MALLEITMERIQEVLRTAANNASVPTLTDNIDMPLPDANLVLETIDVSKKQNEQAWELYVKLLSIGLSTEIILEIFEINANSSQELRDAVTLFLSIRAINTPLIHDNLDEVAELMSELFQNLMTLGIPSYQVIALRTKLLEFDKPFAQAEFELLESGLKQ